MHIHMQTCTFTCAHAHMHIHMHTAHSHAHMHIHMRTAHSHAHMHAHWMTVHMQIHRILTNAMGPHPHNFIQWHMCDTHPHTHTHMSIKFHTTAPPFEVLDIGSSAVPPSMSSLSSSLLSQMGDGCSTWRSHRPEWGPVTAPKTKFAKGRMSNLGISFGVFPAATALWKLKQKRAVSVEQSVYWLEEFAHAAHSYKQTFCCFYIPWHKQPLSFICLIYT